MEKVAFIDMSRVEDVWSVSFRALEKSKGWLANAKLRPLSLFIALLLMLKEAFDNARIEK